jgi:hypothetical protein
MKKASLLLVIVCSSALIVKLWAQTGIVQLPATGQTISYHPGDDGDLQIGIPLPANRFLDHANGTLTDSLTGLMWVSDGNLLSSRDPSFDQDRTAGDGDVDWKTALEYISFLNQGQYLGYDDWRLPNERELLSLVNLSLADTALPGNHPFTNLQDLYWSSTTSEQLRSTAVGVFLYEHYAHSNIINPAGEAEDFFKNPSAYLSNYWGYYVLPVRGTTSNGLIQIPQTGQRYTFFPGDDGDIKSGVAWPTPRLVDNQDETVTDRLTGLMWTRDANLMLTRDPGFDTTQWVDGEVPWERALDYVVKLNQENYLGFNDWRLPNRHELNSLVDYSQHDLALPERAPFKNLAPVDFNFASYYWTSTTRADEPDQAWMMEFYDGLMGGGNALAYAKTRDMLAWPVRTSNQALPTAAITGTITLDGNPYPRAEVSLEGPINGFVRTKLNGEFAFNNLPNGSYIVRPEHKYARFDPLSCELTLNDDTLICPFDAAYSRAYGWVEISENLFPSGGAAGGCFSDLWFIGNEGWITNSCFFNEIYHTTDGGDTWEVQSTLTPNYAIYMMSADTGYAGGGDGSGFLHKTTDGGQSWNFFAVGPRKILSIGFSPDGTTGWCGAFEGYLYEITPNVLTAQFTNYTDWSAISFGSADFGWAVSCFGRKMIYENGTWTYYGGAQYFPCFGDVHFNRPKGAWISQGGRMIRYQEDVSWQTFFQDTLASLQGVFALDTNHVWAVSTGGDILYTSRASDDTVHFAVDNVGKVFLNDIFATDPHHAWAIGNNGSLYRYGVLEGFPSGEAEIIDVVMDHQIGPAQIDASNRTVSVLLSDSADLSQVFPEIYLSAGATVNPPSGALRDFTQPVTYTVTSENQQIVNTWVITATTATAIFPEPGPGEVELRLFPNPATDLLNIQYPVLSRSKLFVYNAMGILVQGQNLAAGSTEISLDVSGWPGGIYFVKLSSEKATLVRKFMVR